MSDAGREATATTPCGDCGTPLDECLLQRQAGAFCCAYCVDHGHYEPAPVGRRATWTIKAEGFDCPLCFHGSDTHDGEACSVTVGYDHLNGDHECGCPMTPPAREATP